MPGGFPSAEEEVDIPQVIMVMPGHDDRKEVKDYGATQAVTNDQPAEEELDEYGLPKRRKKWSKRPACGSLILLIIGGLLGRYVWCGA